MTGGIHPEQLILDAAEFQVSITVLSELVKIIRFVTRDGVASGLDSEMRSRSYQCLLM